MSAAPTETAATAAPAGNALQIPSFRFLWLNSITFFMAANALRFVYGWVVLEDLDGNETMQGLVVFMLGLPGIFLLLPAGVWADRINRRHLLVGTQIATVAVMAATALAIAGGANSIGLMMASSLLAGATTSVGSPVRSSLLPELLPKELLFSGIALNALAMTASMIIGALTAQMVGNAFGFDGTFWYLGILLVLGTFAAMRIVTPDRASATEERPTMRIAVREGMAFVFKDRALRVLFLLLALAGFVMNALIFVTLQAFVKAELGRNAGDAAPLLAIMGVGLAATSIIVMKRGDMANKGAVFMRAMMVGTTTLALMGRTTAFWQLMVLCLIMGMAGGFFINMNQGLIQANTPNELMGRVMGLYTLVQGGLTPIGALVLGLLASAIGVGNTMTWAALFALVVVIITYWRADDLRRMA